MVNLIEPSCILGYTDSDLNQLLGNEKSEFYAWMRGQTFTSCDGKAYDPELRAYRDTGCGPHGYVFYVADVARFMRGLPVID